MKKKQIIPAMLGGVIGGIAGYSGAKYFAGVGGNREMILPFIIETKFVKGSFCKELQLLHIKYSGSYK